MYSPTCNHQLIQSPGSRVWSKVYRFVGPSSTPQLCGLRLPTLEIQ